MEPSKLINIIAPAIIIPFGTFGNCLALWTILSSPTLRKRSVNVFMITIFISDLMTNSSVYFVKWILILSVPNMTALYDSDKVTFHNNSSKLTSLNLISKLDNNIFQAFKKLIVKKVIRLYSF